MVKVITMIGERVFEAEVDNQELARDLKMASAVAKYRGLRPGQPTNLTTTPSDPISQEKFATLYRILQTLKKNK